MIGERRDALAAARLADDGVDLATGDAQVDVLHDGDAAPCAVENSTVRSETSSRTSDGRPESPARAAVGRRDAHRPPSAASRARRCP